MPNRTSEHEVLDRLQPAPEHGPISKADRDAGENPHDVHHREGQGAGS